MEQSTVNRSRKGAARIREDTIRRKKASGLFQELRGRRWLLGRMLEVISEGKRGLDSLIFNPFLQAKDCCIVRCD